MTSSLKKQMLWNAVGNAIYLVCQWLLVVLVTNMGGFSDAGVLSIAMSVSATFQTVAMFGIRSFQVSDLTGEYTDTHYVGFRLVTCTLSLLLCVGFSLVAHYLGIQLLAIFLFMLFRLAESFSDVLHGIAQKNDRLDIAGKSFAIKGIGLLIAFYASYRFVGNLCFSLFLMAAFSILSTVLFDYFIVRRFSKFTLLVKSSDCFSIALKTFPLCLYMFFHSALSTVPKIFLERLLGEELLGAYSSVFAPVLLISAVAIYVYQPFVGAFAATHRDGKRKEFLSLLLKIVLVLLAFSVMMLITAHFLGAFALSLVFGDKILEYTDFLTPILFGIIGIALLSLLETLTVILRDFVWLLIGCGIGLASELALSYPLIRSAGANGASYVMIIATALASVILLFRILCLAGKRKEPMA